MAEQSEAEGLCEKILDAFKGTNRNISCFPSSAFARATEARPYYILSHGRISAIESKFDDHKPFGTQISAITLSKYQSYGISDKARFSLMAVFNPKDLEKVSLKKAIAIAEPAICKKTTEFLRAGAELAVRRNVTPEANARPEANALLKFSLFGLDAQPDVKYEIYNMLCEHFQLDPEWKIYLMFDPSRAPPAQEGPIAKINPVETIGYNDKTVTAIVNFPK